MTADALPLPGDAEAFTLRTLSHLEVPRWFHVYGTRDFPLTATSFNEGHGASRFAPLRGADGQPLHTYYAASTPECAYMESLLHDVALQPPGVFEVARLAHYHLATLELDVALQCVSLHTKDLPRLHLTRAQLIDSAPTAYPLTRAWAQAAFDQRPDAQALSYTSRRDDAGRCLLLCRQRLPTPPFRVVADEPLALAPRRQEVLALVRSLGLFEV
jgi:hypothetical protein